MCRRKSSKKKLTELTWGSRRSSYKIEWTAEGVKPCIIQLTHRAPKRGLELLPCNGSASTCTVTSCRLLSAPITWWFLNFELREKTNAKRTLARNTDTNALNQRAPDRAPLDIPLPQRLITIAFRIGHYGTYTYEPGAGYLLSIIDVWGFANLVEEYSQIPGRIISDNKVSISRSKSFIDRYLRLSNPSSWVVLDLFWNAL